MSRSLIAEFLGTFTLVFIGAFAVAVTGYQAANANVLVPALAHGLILVALAFAYGGISGGHFNPAVTVGMLVGGKIDAARALAYIVVQLVGGIAAAYILFFILGAGPELNFGAAKGALTDTNLLNASIFEGFLTFFLVSTIYQTAVHGRAGSVAAIAIGFTLAACILAGGYHTGASLNPARTLGPALVAGDLSYVIPYIVAQLIGGAAAGLIHSYLLTKD
jgi:MIP family channel proteins